MPFLVSHSLVGNDQPLHSSYDSIPVTPSDSVDLSPLPSEVCVGFIVGGAGNVAATTLGGVAVTFTAVPVNVPIDAPLKRVLATGTTATSIQSLYRPRER